MKIAIVTDAWHPQVNGVVRTYENTTHELRELGHEVCVVGPGDFRTVACPTYPSIRLAVHPGPRLGKMLDAFQPDAIHVATEGPLGHAARRYCLKHKLPFTSSFHTQFPEYIRMRMPIPLAWSYAYVRRFHRPASRTLVPTGSQRQRLIERGFSNVVTWSRGVDSNLFRPARDKSFLSQPRPVFIYMGRVSVEKNIEAFLGARLPGTKMVVGDGPDLSRMRERYPDAVFTGYRFGEELACYLAAADVFVFPSLTDTYGLVMLEAMACGLPVAAHPVTGPIDIINNGVTGVMNEDLREAALQALHLDPQDCIDFARSCSWRRCAEVFVDNLEPLTATSRGRAGAVTQFTF